MSRDWTMAPPPGPNAGVSVPITQSSDKPLYQPRDQVKRTPKVAYRAQLGSSTGVLYTAPAVTGLPTGTPPSTSLLKSLNVCNCDTVARTFTITIGGTTDAYAVFKDATIAAKTTYTFIFADDEFPLADSETINGLADSANKVTVRIGVVEITS